MGKTETQRGWVILPSPLDGKLWALFTNSISLIPKSPHLTSAPMISAAGEQSQPPLAADWDAAFSVGAQIPLKMRRWHLAPALSNWLQKELVFPQGLGVTGLTQLYPPSKGNEAEALFGGRSYAWVTLPFNCLLFNCCIGEHKVIYWKVISKFQF